MRFGPRGHAVSGVCRKYDISVPRFYNWQKILFERAAQLFDRKPNAANVRRQEVAAEKKVEALEAKLVQKNEVIAELLQQGRERFPGARPRIISDFVKISGMTHVRTSPFYPQSNGRTERCHRTIKSQCIRPSTPRKASRQPPDADVSSSVSQDRALLGSNPSV
jgi:transposase-like protein